MGDDPDRAAILRRRNRLIALALSGVGATAGCTEPAPCLAPPMDPPVRDEQPTGPTVPEEPDEPAALPLPCLTPRGPEEPDGPPALPLPCLTPRGPEEPPALPLPCLTPMTPATDETPPEQVAPNEPSTATPRKR